MGAVLAVIFAVTIGIMLRVRSSASAWLQDDVSDIPCTMRAIDVRGMHREHIASIIHAKREPVLLRHAMDARWWAERDAVLTAYGNVELSGVVGGDEFAWAPEVPNDDLYRYILGRQADAMHRVQLPLSSWMAAMRNRSVTEDDYFFHNLEESPISDALPDELRSLSDWLYLMRHGPAEWTPHQRRKFMSSSVLRRAVRSAPYLLLGVNGSGSDFHRHADALLGLLAGEKHWLITSTSATSSLASPHMQPRNLFRLLRERGALGTEDGHASEYWQCLQRPGDVMWIPTGLSHAVVNRGEVIGVSMQMSPGMPLEPIMRAAYHGHVEGLRSLVTECNISVSMHNSVSIDMGPNESTRYGDGGTALHAAVHAGHGASVIDTLVHLGASLTSKNDDGLCPLSLAARFGKAASAAALLRAGAFVDEPDTSGVSPLQYAVISRYSNSETVNVLLDAGAGPSALLGALRMGEKVRQHLGREVEGGASALKEARAHKAHVVEAMGLVSQRAVDGAEATLVDGESR